MGGWAKPKLIDEHVELLAHLEAGRVHHDVVARIDDEPAIVVIATNCNGGIKEVLRLAEVVPERPRPAADPARLSSVLPRHAEAP